MSHTFLESQSDNRMTELILIFRQRKEKIREFESSSKFSMRFIRFNGNYLTDDDHVLSCSFGANPECSKIRFWCTFLSNLHQNWDFEQFENAPKLRFDT